MLMRTGIGLLSPLAVSRVSSYASALPARESATSTRLPVAPLPAGVAAYQGGGQAAPKPAAAPAPAPASPPVVSAATFVAEVEAAKTAAKVAQVAATPYDAPSTRPIAPAGLSVVLPAVEPARAPSYVPPAAAPVAPPAALSPVMPLALQGPDAGPAPAPRGGLQSTPIAASLDIPTELWIGVGVLGAAVVLGGVFLATRHLQPARRPAPRRRRPFSVAP